jgi:hypothetical protein
MSDIVNRLRFDLRERDADEVEEMSQEITRLRADLAQRTADLARANAEVAALKPQSNADEFASIPLRAWVVEVFQHLCQSPHTPDEWKRDLDKKTIALLNAIEQEKKGER